MQSAAIAALVAMVGRAVVKRVKFFQTYCVPGVVVAGLVVSFVLGILRGFGVLQVEFDVAVLKEWFMDIFFTGVGLTASWKLIKQGGRVCIGIRHCHHRTDFVPGRAGRGSGHGPGDASPPGPGPGLPVSDGRRGHLQRHRSHL